jgi:hypothetical protein
MAAIQVSGVVGLHNLGIIEENSQGPARPSHCPVNERNSRCAEAVSELTEKTLDQEARFGARVKPPRQCGIKVA